jgi:hypothetical protein
LFQSRLILNAFGFARTAAPVTLVHVGNTLTVSTHQILRRLVSMETGPDPSIFCHYSLRRGIEVVATGVSQLYTVSRRCCMVFHNAIRQVVGQIEEKKPGFSEKPGF